MRRRRFAARKQVRGKGAVRGRGGKTRRTGAGTRVRILSYIIIGFPPQVKGNLLFQRKNRKKAAVREREGERKAASRQTGRRRFPLTRTLCPPRSRRTASYADAVPATWTLYPSRGRCIRTFPSHADAVPAPSAPSDAALSVPADASALSDASAVSAAPVELVSPAASRAGSQ